MSHRHNWRRLAAAAASVVACSAALLAPQATAAAAAPSATTTQGASKTFTSVKAKTVVSTTVRPGKTTSFSTKAPRAARAVYLAVYVTGAKKSGTVRVHGAGKKPLARSKVTVKRGVPAARTLFVPVNAQGRAVLRSSARAKVQARIVGYSTSSATPKVKGAKASKTVRKVKSRSVSLGRTPSRATAVVVTVKTWGARKAAKVSLCSTRDKSAACKATVRAVGAKGSAQNTKTIVPLLGANKLALRSNAPLSARVNVQGYVLAPPSAKKPPVPTRPGKPGVPAGTTLKKIYGDQTITKAGTVLNGVEIYGRVSIKAANVTIKNSRIRAQKPNSAGIVNSKSPGVVIRNTEIFSDVRNPDTNGIMGYGFTLDHVEIRDVVDHVHIHGNDVVIRDSWLHSNTHYEQDPNWGGKPSHDDNIQVTAGKNILVERTRIADSHSAAIMLTQDRGVIGNVLVRNNTIGGGACSINVAPKSYGALSNVNITGNTFTRTQTKLKGCAVIAPKESRPTLSSNTWADTGKAASIW
ncbi:right-handed parallel beta-helix repeat-containing protein [Aeromicrobium sp.]|uniref:right-handed parallel beta-helix repeat-containing protein n=1 Tax=Aeromicrobium sp. TaxID=1871063 RepID=UPI0028AD747C|nr:right-handed parallel beta-helix repeat-containing protein [Aeromicrobium sp.]